MNQVELARIGFAHSGKIVDHEGLRLDGGEMIRHCVANGAGLFCAACEGQVKGEFSQHARVPPALKERLLSTQREARIVKSVYARGAHA